MTFCICIITSQKSVEKQFYYENNDRQNHYLKKKFQRQLLNVLLDQTTVPSKVRYAMQIFNWTFGFICYVMEFYNMSDADLF